LDHSFFELPFFEDSHRNLAVTLNSWAAEKDWESGESGERKKVDRICRGYVRLLGQAGWLGFAVPAQYGGQHEDLDVRSLCIVRETLASYSGLADFAFAMQGLGAGPISLFGSADLREKYLPAVANGSAIPAFAISESAAGSDVAAMKTVARRDGDSYIIDGEKTWISNGGIADFYVVFARTDDPSLEGEKHFTAFVVEKGDDGFEIADRIETIAPHPLATLRFTACRVPIDRVVGEPGRGLRVALGTLDVFRTTVGAAALGFARRALGEALNHVMHREMFGGKLADFQLTQASIAEMATEIDSSALLIYRSAWTRDNGQERVTREAAMAKMYATEAAQRVIDRAVQLFGGRGVVSGNSVERLYREIRALRIYEGATEVQKLVIAGQVMRHAADQEVRNG
jgi:alkylation response protein AidB-like acyl-CoA dehydrogenase